MVSKGEEEARKRARTHSMSPQFWGRSPRVYYIETENRAKEWETDPAPLAAKKRTGLDALALAEEAAIGWQLGNRTLFKSVKRMLPGERIVSSRNRDIVETSSYPEAPSCIIENLSAQVCEAFEAGAALEFSGGLDSRLLLALGLHRGVRPELSFTIGEENFPDAINAAAIADRFGVAHLRIPPTVNRERIREDIIAFIRRSGYSVNAVTHAWLPGTLSKLDEVRTAQVSGLVGEICGGFYYTPYDSVIERLGLERQWVAMRLMSPRSRWSFLWHVDIAQDLEARIYAEADIALHSVDGSWRERTDAFYRNERVRRWAIPVLDACEELYQVITPLLSPEYFGWATAIAPSARTRDRQPERELLRRAFFALEDFRGPIQQSSRLSTSPTVSKILRRLAGQNRKSDLGAVESAVALAEDSRLREWISAMCAHSNLELSTEGVERVLGDPIQYPELVGVLVTASVAWNDLCQSSCENA